MILDSYIFGPDDRLAEFGWREPELRYFLVLRRRGRPLLKAICFPRQVDDKRPVPVVWPLDRRSGTFTSSRSWASDSCTRRSTLASTPSLLRQLSDEWLQAVFVKIREFFDRGQKCCHLLREIIAVFARQSRVRHETRLPYRNAWFPRGYWSFPNQSRSQLPYHPEFPWIRQVHPECREMGRAAHKL